MKKVQILIDAPEKAQRLCNILSHYQGAFDIAKGNYCVDGKSILGIYTMDLSKPLLLSIYDETEPVLEEIKEFVV